MTIIQVYFHRFSDPLPPEKAPPPPIAALKMMSYSIQAESRQSLERAGIDDSAISLGIVHASDPRFWIFQWSPPG
jgi:hypothetical protein